MLLSFWSANAQVLPAISLFFINSARRILPEMMNTLRKKKYGPVVYSFDYWCKYNIMAWPPTKSFIRR